jgi:hypothetical protein
VWRIIPVRELTFKGFLVEARDFPEELAVLEAEVPEPQTPETQRSWMANLVLAG